MNVDYIRTKCRELNFTKDPKIQDTLLVAIAVCAGIRPSQKPKDFLPAPERDKIKGWLKENATRLNLPPVKLLGD